MTLRRYTRHDDFHALHMLLHQAFAHMEGRIDPPSSMTRLTPDGLRGMADECEIWVLEQRDQPIACMILTPEDGNLYLGKLAVSHPHRAQGHARDLIHHAEDRCRALRLAGLTLETRIELTENHSAFSSLGFRTIGSTAHPGYDHPTSLTMFKPVTTQELHS
ncbi:Acetyltransferase (GNAT) family protein [Roseovarius albus]|uniref:Acetyltransferase (GNAT) family protein n=1 Tax=Roseovarius albus TaxID=1247867 RepID=A0A1X7A7W7_9RHOB|nr:GNAT family N-acetyltransferase [Roseovarius albus]SLN72873.1 Acetyltransferase (GNAT) family protein [Roseovarius albus]